MTHPAQRSGSGFGPGFGQGRSLPPASPFAGDDGSADPALAAALALPDGGTRLRAVSAALASARVLVPVVAHLEEAEEAFEHHGVRIAGEKSASAAMVTLAGPDGRAVMPIFSSVATVQAWRADARPIPAEGIRAALSAVSEADGLLVLDPGGPVTVTIPRPAVWAIAQGRPWVPAASDPQVLSAVGEALSRGEHLREVSVEPGERAEVRVILGVAPGLDRRALDALLATASAALSANNLVAERVDSLEFRIIAVS